MIKLQSLACGFDNHSVLEDITLDIASHLSILGANGSGKSTLARAICGLTGYEGEVSLFGESIQNIAPKTRAKTISYIPAKLDIYDSFITVFEFVLLGRFPYKKSFFEYDAKDKIIAQKTIAFLNIRHLSSHTVASLSSGEQQLVLIAQALAQQSKIIIFDEPTANLDPRNAKIIAEHIKGLKEYHQIILITHDLHLACFVGSPIAFIKEKRVTLYEEGFFEDANLEELYGVAFSSMAVRYA